MSAILLRGLALASVLVAVAAAVVAQPATPPAPAAPADARLPLVIDDDERHLVLMEMRNFLAVLQTISNALVKEDMKAIAAAARTMGSGAANEIPPRTVAKLPEEFKMLAGGVHTTFDLIAMDAEVLGDTRHTLSQMSDMLQKCNACHGIYQIQAGRPGR